MKVFRSTCDYGVHDFQPRYDKGAAVIPDREWKANGVDLVEFMETLRPKTYVRDICRKCGKTIEREVAR